MGRSFRFWLGLLGCISLLHKASNPPFARAGSPTAAGVEGVWQGMIQSALRLVVHVEKKPEGSLTGTLDSPDQGALGLGIDTLWFANDSLKFEMLKLHASFEGRMSDDRAEIAGQWKQGGFTLPLTLKRLEKAPEYRRPQEPQKPYPYDEEEVTVENQKAGIKLAGTLTIPRERRSFSCVLLITGSGPEDRDETVSNHRPFLILADHLTRRGIAVLRLDDRGVGKSTGQFAGATSEDFAGDMLAGVEYLKSRREIDPKKIGLIGHSEGGLIAPMVATRSKDVAFVVLMAGPGLPGDQIMLLQGTLIRKAAGAPDSSIARERGIQERMFAVLGQESDSTAAADRLRPIVEEALGSAPGGQAMSEGNRKERVDAQLRTILSPWFRFFLTYDPRPALKHLSCPILAINGEKDLQVPAAENLAAIEQALRVGRNKDYTVKQLPGLNHLFQTCRTGAVSEYAQIEETMSPAALEEIAGWITKRTAMRR